MKKILSIFCLFTLINITYGEAKYMPQDNSGTNIIAYYNADNTTEEVKVIDGRKEGKSKEIYPDGRIFYSTYKHGVRQGEGKIEYPNGDIEIINIKDGLIQGETIFKSSNGEYIIKGQYLNGLIDGDFITTDKNGNLLQKETFILGENLKTIDYGDGFETVITNTPMYTIVDLKSEDDNLEMSYKVFKGKLFGQSKIVHQGNVYTQTFINSKPITMAKVVYQNGKIKYGKSIKELLPNEFKEVISFDFKYNKKDKKMTKSFNEDEIKGKIKDGKIEGLLEYKDEKYDVKTTSMFKNDELDGETIIYLNEKTTLTFNMKNNLLNGEHVQNFGEYSLIVNFKDGRVVGDCYIVEKNVKKIHGKADESGLLIRYLDHFKVHEGDTIKGYYKVILKGADKEMMQIVTKANGQIRRYGRLNEYQGGGEYIELKSADKK
ncbi:toxin-antitoxin system YwqK family antitoxin [Oceanivirga salmonicida]|uniref:toxin-antitoxin system YwqK family antitoxin n=1 Tax=Oceanivirga salmonicida TaxID=1769291 RepID=UPI0008360B9C|nr:hypothetical protein [Oceanivirga salmonicida]